MSALATRWVDIGERLNPVLVREVRQALRGRFFLFTFSLTLLFGMVASITVMIAGDRGATPGRDLFSACLGFLSLTTVLLVPIGAFQSLGAEHDDDTRDLLVLSNLSPGQIIRGKFFTFLLLALLFTVALGPFLALSTLLHGVDLLQIGGGLASILMYCAAYTMIALCLSAMAVGRGLRLLLMLGMVVFLLMGLGRTAMFGSFAGGSAIGQFLLTAIGVGVVGSFAYTLGCTRFAHPEENRATALRVYISVAVFGVSAFMLLFGDLGSGSFMPVSPSSWTLDQDAVIASLSVFSFTALFFVTESSVLSARVRIQVPRSRVLAILAYPFLPGGGKAVVWYLLNAGLYLGVVSLFAATGATGHGHPLGAGLFFVLATLGCLFLPSAILRPLTRKPTGRAWLVFAPLLLWTGSFIVTEIYGAAMPTTPDSQLWRVASPLGIVHTIGNHGGSGLRLIFLIYGVLGVISLLANLPRIWSELKAVLVASSNRLPLDRDSTRASS